VERACVPHDMLAARWGGGAAWPCGGAPLAEFLPSLALDHLAGGAWSQSGLIPWAELCLPVLVDAEA